MIDFKDSNYDDLISSLNRGTCIFYGAGISKLAGYKLWDELKNELVDYFWMNRENLKNSVVRFDLSIRNNLKKHDKIIEVFDYLYHKDSDFFISGIDKILNSDSKKLSNRIYEHLNKLNNGKNFFVTTNIDDSFQRYLGLDDENVSIYPNFEFPPKLITYLHGRIDKKDSWIFTTGQYNKAYKNESGRCSEFLANLFQNYNVLFIGYGLSEEIVLRTIYSTKQKKHYWIEGIYRNNHDYLLIRSTSLRENYNIVLAPYSIDENGHESLYLVIDKLYETISKIRGN